MTCEFVPQNTTEDVEGGLCAEPDMGRVRGERPCDTEGEKNTGRVSDQCSAWGEGGVEVALTSG